MKFEFYRQNNGGDDDYIMMFTTNKLFSNDKLIPLKVVTLPIGSPQEMIISLLPMSLLNAKAFGLDPLLIFYLKLPNYTNHWWGLLRLKKSANGFEGIVKSNN